jgi:hypothetical protein
MTPTIRALAAPRSKRVCSARLQPDPDICLATVKPKQHIFVCYLTQPLPIVISQTLPFRTSLHLFKPPLSTNLLGKSPTPAHLSIVASLACI